VYFGLANEKGYPHKGYLDFAAITLSPTTGTLLLRGVFANPDFQVLPGLFARVRAPAGKPKPALLVPEVALGYDQIGPYVLVVDDKNVVKRVTVKLGTQVDDDRVVEEGLQPSDWVIVSGLLRAIPGKKVNPQKATAQESAGSKTSQASPTGPGKSAP
jgi:RND family efflux transporter MFP subunit